MKYLRRATVHGHQIERTNRLRGSLLKTLLSISLFAAFLLPSSAWSATRPGQRILKFSGVPAAQATALRKKFPLLFEREPTLAEVDELVRFLMSTGAFSNIEVVERPNGEFRELTVVAATLRKVRDVKITGNNAMSSDEITKILNVGKGSTFERKNLIETARQLQGAYADLGYYNSKVEVDFELPNEAEVDVLVNVTEGPATKISDVIIDAANPGLNDRLKRFTKSLIGHTITGSELLEFNKSVTEFLKKNRYLTARLSDPTTSFSGDRQYVKLNYTIENPWKFEFIFEGNNYFSDGSILRQIELDKLTGSVSSPAPDLAEKIRRAYQSVGFANVEVEFTDKLYDDAHKQVIQFKITEGPRVRIRQIEVSGNISRPDSYYAQFIKSSSSDLIGSGYYNRRDIEDGTKKLVTELQNQGFMRAKVQSQRVDYSKDKASVTVHLVIEEGPLTQIRQIRLEGVEAFPKTMLTDMLKIKAGAALSLRDLEESIQKLKDFYRGEGYLEMRITNENERDRIVTYNDSNTQAVVEFQIHEGSKVSVASIALDGNSFTKEYVIRRELAFKQGDVLTPAKIDDSVFRLQKLGLFSSVRIRTLEENTNIGERTVIVEVAERDPGLFSMGMGAASEREGFVRFRGYIGIAYRNILGTGRGLSFRVDPSYSNDPRISYIENRTTVSYLEPYILGDSNRGRINLIREQAFYNFDANGHTVIQESNTAGFLIERDLTHHLKLTHTAYSFSNQRKFDRSSLQTLEMQNIAKVGPLFELDYRNDVFNPSKGSYSFLALEYSDPMLGSSDDSTQSINFVKSYASTTYYLPLRQRKNWVWANSIRGGYLSNLSRKPVGGVPSQEAFFLGGRTTIRGFDASDLERIPNNRDLGVASLRDFRLTSDSEYFLLKTELRFPLWSNSPLGDIGGALFYDGGAVLISQPDVHQPDPYRDSVGVGVRIATPVGPVNLEIGWKLDRRLIQVNPRGYDVRETPWAFHFSIGTF